MSTSISGVGAQDDHCTTTISDLLCIPHLFHSSNSPIPPTKYGILRNGILIMVAWFHEIFN
jgi:hypothetical protein